MKGILFNHLEELTNSVLSSKAWQELCEGLPIQTQEIFIANRNYPDSDLQILLKGFAEKAGLKIPDAWRKFGHLSIPMFMKKFPDIISQYKTPKSLLMDINTLHFTKVREKFTETELPFFFVSNPQEKSLVLRYVSKRKMCFYLEGALDGVGEYFKMPIKHKQTICTHKGDDICEFDLFFEL